MSKQHTPWTMDEYSKEITVLDANRDYVFSVRMAIDPSKKREYVKHIIKSVNNHDKLVEVLKWITDSEDDNDLHNAIDKGIELLTELKS